MSNGFYRIISSTELDSRQKAVLHAARCGCVQYTADPKNLLIDNENSDPIW